MTNRQKEIRSTVMYIILVAVGVVMLFPVFWMFLACFKTNNEIFGSLKLLPSSWSFEAFAKGWQTTGTFTYTRYFSNTFLLVVPTVIFTIVSCSLVAYGFARFEFKSKNVLFMVLITTLMLPNSVIIIPRYALFNKLHWLDSYLTYWVPAIFACYPFFVFMMVQFLRGIPKDLDESAYMDGCTSFRCFVQILVPLLKPAIFSAALFQFRGTGFGQSRQPGPGGLFQLLLGVGAHQGKHLLQGFDLAVIFRLRVVGDKPAIFRRHTAVREGATV